MRKLPLSGVVYPACLERLRVIESKTVSHIHFDFRPRKPFLAMQVLDYPQAIELV
jgi:hypothetical protein